MMETEAAASPAESELPAEFDHNAYVAHPQNADLRHFGPDGARHHYQAYGRAEGRPCSVVDGRAAFLALIPEGPLLEIGPYCRPCFAPGSRPVRMLDAFTTHELRDMAAREGLDPGGVPDIDFVWQGQPYRELIRERFDAVVASHSLERQPCLITHLTDVASVLRLGGHFFLVLEDRRYSGAHYLPNSTLADILEPFATRGIRHAPRNVFAERLFRTHDNAAAHWGGHHGPDASERIADAQLMENVAQAMRKLRASPGYIDVPAWRFTPDSFRYLIDVLASIGLSPFRAERIYPTVRPKSEFYAVLRIAA
jgi:hypothetical protein